jgi:hypothetical protein
MFEESRHLVENLCHYRFTASYAHRNQSISRKGAYIISRRGSHGQFARRCCPQAFLRIFSEVTYIYKDIRKF